MNKPTTVISVRGRNRDEPHRWDVAIPIHFTGLNKLMRMHWSRRSETLEDEARVILWFCNVAGVPKASGKRRIGQRITNVGRDRKLDNDNAWKSVLDGLVKSGRLIDDSLEFVETTTVEYLRGTERQTVITIEDVRR